MPLVKLLGWLAQTVVTFVVFIVLALIAFYVTVFVVSTGAALAGYDPSGEYVVLSASLLVVAALLGGIPFRTTNVEDTYLEDGESPTGFH